MVSPLFHDRASHPKDATSIPRVRYSFNFSPSFPLYERAFFLLSPSSRLLEWPSPSCGSFVCCLLLEALIRNWRFPFCPSCLIRLWIFPPFPFVVTVGRFPPPPHGRSPLFFFFRSWGDFGLIDVFQAEMAPLLQHVVPRGCYSWIFSS